MLPSNKRRYPHNTHSANSYSITIKHLTNHPKVLDSRPDPAVSNLALMALMLPFLLKEDILKEDKVTVVVALL